MAKLSKQHKPSKIMSMGGSGMCARKHYYKTIGVVPEPPNDDSLRLMRVGTIIHEDVAAAIKDCYGDEDALIEKDVELLKYNCRGRIDLYFPKIGKLVDVKTIAAYKWRTMFGRKATFTEASKNYQLQVGIYAAALIEENYPIDSMAIAYFNRDTAKIKEVEVKMKMIEEAKTYWMTVNDAVNSGEPPVELGFAPMQEWECNHKYCSFYEKCGGGLNNEDF